MASDPTTRFTSRVANYVRTRPDYPDDLLSLLEREYGLGPGTTVADVGSGTGILTRRLLDAGAEVMAVEPNAAMREAAEALLGENARFRSVAATAEATTLGDASVDLVVVAQAFHWFDRAATRREFVRILREPRRVALIWNERVETGTPFLEGYEALLREYAGDYLAVRHNAILPEELDAWFGGGMRIASFANAQRFDFEGALGRLESSSYAPQADDARHTPMVAELRRLFDATQEGGTVEFRYETRAYYGLLV